jgi:hypothetical protein
MGLVGRYDSDFDPPTIKNDIEKAFAQAIRLWADSQGAWLTDEQVVKVVDSLLYGKDLSDIVQEII